MGRTKARRYVVRRAALAPIVLFPLFVALLTGRLDAQGYADLVAQLKPAVVFIHVIDPPQPDIAGTGFFIHPDGYILTAQHVVAKAKKIFVRLSSGITKQAEAVGSLETADSALLRVSETTGSYPTIPLGDWTALRQGDEVLAFGYPGLGLDDVTVTHGIVSAFRDDGLIQIDAALNAGESGGPVVSVVQGSAVGMAFGIGTRPRFSGVNFAVSIRESVPLLRFVPGGVPTVRTAPTPALSPAAEHALAGNWAGAWASARTNRGGAFVVSIVQLGSSISGTAALRGNRCFAGLQIAGTVSDDGFSMEGYSAGIERVRAAGRVAGKPMSGEYAVLFTRTWCDGDRGTFNATLQ